MTETPEPKQLLASSRNVSGTSTVGRVIRKTSSDELSSLVYEMSERDDDGNMSRVTTQGSLQEENERLREQVVRLKRKLQATIAAAHRQPLPTRSPSPPSLHRVAQHRYHKRKYSGSEQDSSRGSTDDDNIGLMEIADRHNGSLHHRRHPAHEQKTPWRDDEEEAMTSFLADSDNAGEFGSDADGLVATSRLPRNSSHHATGEGNDHDLSFRAALQDRASWLIGLLCLQSMSSFIIARNENLLSKHLVIVQFLTMLVGAGGNAGNQASVRVIRGLAVGTVSLHHRARLQSFVQRELFTGIALSALLGLAGYIRAALFAVPVPETVAITMSLCLIVLMSVVLGVLLPLLMTKLSIDPAHSSTTIQVLMDILGVTITVCVSSALLDSSSGGVVGQPRHSSWSWSRHTATGLEDAVGAAYYDRLVDDDWKQ